MPHWLEEAEKFQKPPDESISRSERIQQKYTRIQENFAKYGELYLAFVQDLHGLISRVNLLPAAQRQPFGKMEGREKESKLNNRLNIFSSSRRLKRSSFWGFLPFLQSGYFKHVRVIFIYVSDTEAMADIELKENILQREMGKADLESDQAKSAKSKKFHVTCRTQMDSLSHEAALEMIDWLAFSKEIEDCNFYRQIPENRKHFH
ncbi:MAG: hypothetical protein H6541_09030 [Lentimicrobiaceae bacterium]|nr:hypothetical protein [Lentimicrobiaceae bacterium]MCO5265235.1 hypothetical protein [Lentimicrobium sp.]